MSDNNDLFSVELVSGPTGPGEVDDFELAHARRALAKLKALIGRQGLLDLLATEIDRGNAYLREKAIASAGKMRAATTVLTIRGLKAAQFVRWLESSFSNETASLAGEPEHFVIAPNPDRTVTIVENIGPHICRVELRPTTSRRSSTPSHSTSCYPSPSTRSADSPIWACRMAPSSAACLPSSAIPSRGSRPT